MMLSDIHHRTAVVITSRSRHSDQTNPDKISRSRLCHTKLLIALFTVCKSP